MASAVTSPTPASLAAAVRRYVALLAYQYADQPNAQAQVALWCGQALLQLLPWALQNCYAFGVAAGQQLDYIGEYVGLTRAYASSGVDFFGFWDSTWSLTSPPVTPAPGMQDSTNFTVNNPSPYLDSRTPAMPSSAMTDLQFQFALQLQIILNSSNGSMAEIQAFLNEFFPNQISVQDGHNMTITYNVPSSLPIPLTVLEALLPAPMGVAITVNVV